MYKIRLQPTGFGCSRQQKRHVAAPPPAGVRRRMERNRQKLVGRDKGSLREQQTEGTATTTILIRRKHDKLHDPQSRSLDRTSARAPEPRVSSRRAAPPPGTPHDGTWYGIPSSVWPGWGWVSPPGCAPSWILVKINPVLAEPRTQAYFYALITYLLIILFCLLFQQMEVV